MEISPQTFREVEFREKRRGYHPADVDSFLEQMEVGVQALHEQVQEALERARRAEENAALSTGGEQAFRRTLVLAQRTADLAIEESRQEAARILAEANQEAETIRTEAEYQAGRHHDDALAEVQAELVRLEAARARAQDEVDALTLWAEKHRAHLRATLKEAAAALERAGVMSPPPSSTPLDVTTVSPDPTGPGLILLPSGASDSDGASDDASESDSDGDPTGAVATTSHGHWDDGLGADSNHSDPNQSDVNRSDANQSGHDRADRDRYEGDRGEGARDDGPGATPTTGREATGGPASPDRPNGDDQDWMQTAMTNGASLSEVGRQGSYAPFGEAAPRPPGPSLLLAGASGGDHGLVSGNGLGPPERNPLTDPDDGSIDNFFEVKDAEEDHRFGGRLRRRR